MPVSVVHQQSSRFLYTLINAWVNHHQLSEAHYPLLLVKLPLPDGREVAREPDIVVILNTNAGRFAEQYFDGAPDLIVVIVSPASCPTDRFVNYAEYETSGVPEYWLVDPERQHAEFFSGTRQGCTPLRSAVRRASIAVTSYWASGWRWSGSGCARRCGRLSSSWS